MAKDTDPVAYPLLQDVNKGWLQDIREDAPERHAAGGELKAETRDADGVVTAAGAIYVGAGEVGTEVDYVNIDALVFAGIELLHENYREDTDLVAIVGRELVNDKYFSIVNASGDRATEQLARDVLLSDKKIGGLTAVRVPKFPKNAIRITTLANLSVYEQIGTERRKIEDNAKRDQIEKLRTAAARRCAEAGCSNQEIKAWTGHTTDSEVARYTAAADQRTLSDTAADKLLANLAERLAKDAAKELQLAENK
jgi:P2 family phage major capsid protein